MLSDAALGKKVRFSCLPWLGSQQIFGRGLEPPHTSLVGLTTL